MSVNLFNGKMKAKFSTLILAVFLLSITLSVLAVPVQALGKVWHVYSGESIQAAVNAASPGDTILVHAGTYEQRTWIHKPLTLIGENPDTTIIYVSEILHPSWHLSFHVTADRVTISGFTVINEVDTAIFLYGSSDCEITENKAKGKHYGIALAGASNNNDITENEAEGILGSGIHVRDGASNNEITENKVTSPFAGIWLWGASNSKIIENEAKNCMIGIYLESQYNDVDNVTQRNKICRNNVDSCYAGIVLNEATNNEITENKVKNCTHGIVLTDDSEGNGSEGNGSDGNKVNFNEIYYNDGVGIWVWREGSKNKICFNEVLGNGVDLQDEGLKNIWKRNEYETSSGI